MPVFHFHVEDGISKPDIDGTVLAGIAEAKIEAVRLAGALMQDYPDHIIGHEDWSIKVTDETGLHLFSFIFFGIDSAALGS